MSLWHWRNYLFKLVFDNWIDFLNIRKEKRSREEAALEWRKDYLRVDGVRSFLKFNHIKSKAREQLFSEKFGKRVSYRYIIALKFGLRWYYKTLRRRSQNQNRSQWFMSPNQPARKLIESEFDQSFLRSIHRYNQDLIVSNSNTMRCRKQQHITTVAKIVASSLADAESQVCNVGNAVSVRPAPRRPIDILIDDFSSMSNQITGQHNFSFTKVNKSFDSIINSPILKVPDNQDTQAPVIIENSNSTSIKKEVEDPKGGEIETPFYDIQSVPSLQDCKKKIKLWKKYKEEIDKDIAELKSIEEVCFYFLYSYFSIHIIS
jgi:hypothetical protein